MTRCLLPLAILIATFAHSYGQTPPVQVSQVKFNNNVGTFKWSNITVKLRANNNPNPEAITSKYLDNVGVRLTVAYEIKGSSKKYIAFQSEVTIATLEVGKDKTFAFWLPYDIVERSGLGKEPDFWVFELTVDGGALPMVKNNASKSLGSAALQESFFSNVVSGQIGDTEGILVPYYLAPYGPVDRSPPAFIRKEPR